MLLVYCIMVVLVVCGRADHEYAEHGSMNTKFAKEHYSADGEHNAHADHKAVLGSRRAAETFDDLAPEESKKRLAVLARQMDSDGDGFVSQEELKQWIYNAMISLDLEDTNERFLESDSNRDGFVTWEEYLKESFGDLEDFNEEVDVQDKRLVEEDRKYFKAADLDNDQKLSADEYNAFQNPEHYQHMHSTLIEITMEEKDTNKDGRIDLDEFLTEIGDSKDSEWHVAEKNRFETEYDVNKNGFLENEELNHWLIFNSNKTAAEEADHLISEADKDKDGRLTINEIVSEYDLFVGSEATNHGEKLVEIRHEEL